MKKALTNKEMVFISSMLFGMFFGAGNLIFPSSLGVAAGGNTLYAYVGMFITAVGLPLLAVASLGISRSDSVLEMTQPVGNKFAIFFVTLLYLTLGPLFAAPRCASTSFSIIGVTMAEGSRATALGIFSFIFFLIVLYLSLHPGKIMTWIGKILNPSFLFLLFVLILTAMLNPIQAISSTPATAAYATPGKALITGFLEGYNTLDALSGLAFGIIVINEIRRMGVDEPASIAKSTISAGVFSCLVMGFVYLLIALMACQSASICGKCSNGSEILGVIAGHYYGYMGTLLLCAIVTLACLKTAVGLITSCSETFTRMFPGTLSYRNWTCLFVMVSFAIANLGLTTIIRYCIPVLMFLYPLAIVFILLALGTKYFHQDPQVYKAAIATTFVAALLDFFNTLTPLLDKSSSLYAFLQGINTFSNSYIPFFSIGLGWIIPALIGLGIGLSMRRKEV